MVTCIFDFETRSDVELKGSNVYVYTESPNADVWALAYCFDDDPVKLWYPSLGEPPRDLMEYVRSGGIMTAHNVAFDRVVWNSVCVPKYGFPALPIEQCRCTMVQALALNLPAGLDDCAGALGLSEKKDEKGGRIAMQLAKPRSNKNGIVTWWTEEEVPEKYEAARAYCVQDVNLTRQVSKRLLPLRDSELQAWFYNERANDRGIPIDVVSALAGKKFVADLAGEFDAEIVAVTKGDVASVTNVGQITAWLGKKGIPVKSIAKDKLEELLSQTGLPDDVRRVLELRRDGGKSSVAKIDAMLDRRTKDGRVKGAMQFHGASTGRVSHRGFQPGNMPRSVLLDSEDEELAYRQMDEILSYIRAGDPDMIRMMYGSPMFAVSDVLRGLIKVSDDHEMFDFDFSNIEGRGLAWAAGEDWKLAAFRDYDNGAGPDLYKVAAGGIFGCSPSEVTKPQRQIGKTSELACIAEGSLVLTDRGLVPIEDVTDRDLVWDGLEWVHQKGPVFRGEKEVISYDGLTATEDHIVWTQDGRSIPFGACAREQIPLLQTGFGREAVRMGHHNFPGHHMDGIEGPTGAQDGFAARLCDLQRLSGGKIDILEQPSAGADEGVSALQSTTERESSHIDGPSVCREKPLPEPERSRISELWRAGNSLPVRFCSRGGCVDSGEPVPPGEANPVIGDRPQGQQWALRTGESSPCGQIRTTEQHPHDTMEFGFRFQKRSGYTCPSPVPNAVPGSSLRRRNDTASSPQRDDARSHRGSILESPFHKTKRRVWDLLEAGPRHRFTVSGRLVHNCGYHGGPSAFAKMGVSLGLNIAKQADVVLANMPQEVIKRAEDGWRQRGIKSGMAKEAWIPAECVKIRWRESHPGVVALWRDIEDAAISAVSHPGDIFSASVFKFRKAGSFLFARLPSGRCLSYPYPRLHQVLRITKTENGVVLTKPIKAKDLDYWAKSGWEPDGDGKVGLVFSAVDSFTKKWCEQFTYSGKLCENLIQALARDLMVEAQIRLEDAGFDVLFTVHDEVCSEAKLGTRDLEEYLAIASELPDWAAGMPVAVAGWKGERFRK